MANQSWTESIRSNRSWTILSGSFKKSSEEEQKHAVTWLSQTHQDLKFVDFDFNHQIKIRNMHCDGETPERILGCWCMIEFFPI
ncbi:hypothetical protein C5167_030608 [Papaver somniferum]|nr:hypothetical protein C5167_030608 [Papaver somniferum]